MFFVSHLLPQSTVGCALKEPYMKMVVAIIRPERLPCVKQALKMVNAELMTVSETHSYGEGEGHPLIYRSSEIRVHTSPKLRVEILTEDIDAEEVVDTEQKNSASFGREDGASRPVRRRTWAPARTAYGLDARSFFALSNFEPQDVT
jgi:nitrogen regulatory protein P-II 1